MKNYIVILILFVSQVVFAQSEDLTGQITLAVKSPSVNLDGLSPSHISKIETKIKTMVSNYGLSGTDYINDFMIYPKYEIYDYSELQTPIGKVQSIEAVLTLIVMEARSGKIFGTLPIELKGEEHGSKEKAVTKSISRIKTSGGDIESFFTNVKQKIIVYYQTHCNQIYKDASTLLNNGAVEKSINLLQMVPRGLTGDCYENVQSKLTEAYAKYNDLKCKKVISDAKQEKAKNNLEYATELLKLISPKSTCYDEAQRELKNMDTPQAQKSAPEEEKAVIEKLKVRQSATVKAVAEKVSIEDDAEFMCAQFGDNCN